MQKADISTNLTKVFERVYHCCKFSVKLCRKGLSTEVAFKLLFKRQVEVSQEYWYLHDQKEEESHCKAQCCFSQWLYHPGVSLTSAFIILDHFHPRHLSTLVTFPPCSLVTFSVSFVNTFLYHHILNIDIPQNYGLGSFLL